MKFATSLIAGVLCGCSLLCAGGCERTFKDYQGRYTARFPFGWSKSYSDFAYLDGVNARLDLYRGPRGARVGIFAIDNVSLDKKDFQVSEILPRVLIPNLSVVERGDFYVHGHTVERISARGRPLLDEDFFEKDPEDPTPAEQGEMKHVLYIIVDDPEEELEDEPEEKRKRRPRKVFQKDSETDPGSEPETDDRVIFVIFCSSLFEDADYFQEVFYGVARSFQIAPREPDESEQKEKKPETQEERDEEDARRKRDGLRKQRLDAQRFKRGI